jgi:two-component system chemotaxis response regulator CheB
MTGGIAVAFTRQEDEIQLIAIGASTGGTDAIYQVLHRLPESLPGIVIVQHIPEGFSKRFADRLHAQTKIKTKEAEHGDVVEPGHAYVAPGDHHIVVQRYGKKIWLERVDQERVNGHRPSVDVMFHSIAQHFGQDALGVLLTGMGSDGAKGLLAMRLAGSYTIGQDEYSSVVYGMPKVAYEIGGVVKQYPLNDIAEAIVKQVGFTKNEKRL